MNADSDHRHTRRCLPSCRFDRSENLRGPGQILGDTIPTGCALHAHAIWSARGTAKGEVTAIPIELAPARVGTEMFGGVASWRWMLLEVVALLCNS